MEQLIKLLNDYSRDPNALQWGVTVSVGLFVFLLITGIFYAVFVGFSPARLRLREVVGQSKPPALTSIGEKLKTFDPYLLPKKDWERNRIDAQLVHGGFRSPQALTLFYSIKTVLGVSFAALAVICAPFVTQLLDRQYSLVQILTAAMFLSFIGLMLPNFCLNRIVEKRQWKIRKGFPDALDMLVVSMEAGIGLAAAIQRVSRELGHSHQELADELALVNAEIRAGVDRGEAFKNLGNRTGVKDIKTFSGIIAQTLHYGTSIADTLRMFAEDFRDKRMQQAEEKAAKLGTKMIFPLVLCFFPSFFVVAIGPAILKLMVVFSRF